MTDSRRGMPRIITAPCRVCREPYVPARLCSAAPLRPCEPEGIDEAPTPRTVETLVDCPLCFGMVGHVGGERVEPDRDCPICRGLGAVTRAARRAFRAQFGSPPSTHPADKEPPR
jgi:hypothetical protein